MARCAHAREKSRFYPPAPHKEVVHMSIKLTVNGDTRELDIDPQMPLLWAIRDHLQLTGTKFGCGMALCGACTVHIDGQATRSCVTPVAAVAGQADHHHRRLEHGRGPRRAGRMDRTRRSAMRLLSERAGHVGGGTVGGQSEAERCGYRCRDGRQTSAAAPRTCASAPPSIRRPKPWHPARPPPLRRSAPCTSAIPKSPQRPPRRLRLPS